MRPTSRFILVILTLSVGPCSTFAQTVKEYNRPEIKYYLQDTILHVAINTDLPPSIIVSITVSRSFWKKESKTEYSIEYFSRPGTVGEWEVVKEISIDETKWRSDLNDQLKSLGRAGLGVSVSKISDSIQISVVVPYTNKPYPKFRQTGRSERLIFAPLGYSAAVVDEFAGPETLVVGHSYTISRVTPLMSGLPSDPLLAFTKTADLPIKSSLTILSVTIVSVSKTLGRPWYEVTAKDKVGKVIGTGWINSVALIGQEITLNK